MKKELIFMVAAAILLAVSYELVEQRDSRLSKQREEVLSTRAFEEWSKIAAQAKTRGWVVRHFDGYSREDFVCPEKYFLIDSTQSASSFPPEEWIVNKDHIRILRVVGVDPTRPDSVLVDDNGHAFFLPRNLKSQGFVAANPYRR